MKKILLTILSLFTMLFVLGSCSDTTVEPPTTDNPPSIETNPETKPEPKPEVPKIDFTLKSSCDAGSIEKDNYTFSEVEAGSDYYDSNDPKIIISVNQANWAYVSMINEKNSKITIESNSVLEDKAVSFKPNLNNSGVINQITLKFDRTKMHVGETRVKVLIDPDNGSTSASNIDLCFNVKVVKFGSFDPKMADVNLNLDLSNLDSKLAVDNVEINVQDQEYVYGYSYKTVQTKVVNKDTKQLTISVPLGHKVLLFVRGYDANNRMHSYYLTLSNDNSYELVNTNHIFNSAPTNALDATIGDKI